MDTPDASPDADPRVSVDTYRVHPTGHAEFDFPDLDAFVIEVVDGGTKHGWGVFKRNRFQCLSAEQTWDHALRGSDVDDVWLAAHRFPRDEALRLALDHVDRLRVYGMTAAEHQINWRTRSAEAIAQ